MQIKKGFPDMTGHVDHMTHSKNAAWVHQVLVL